MRSPTTRSSRRRIALVVLAASAAALSCQKSNTMTGPSTTLSPAAATIAGTWSGRFQAYDSGCGVTSATATFQQSGSIVTGNLKTSDCGVGGYFRGSVKGSTILGTLEQQGCTGGGVSGVVEGSVISLTIGDMTKPLVTGETPRMSGGAVVLSR